MSPANTDLTCLLTQKHDHFLREFVVISMLPFRLHLHEPVSTTTALTTIEMITIPQKNKIKKKQPKMRSQKKRLTTCRDTYHVNDTLTRCVRRPGVGVGIIDMILQIVKKQRETKDGKYESDIPDCSTGHRRMVIIWRWIHFVHHCSLLC